VKRSILFIAFLLIIRGPAALHARTHAVLSEISARLNSNGINDLFVSGDTVWVGSGGGLSYTADKGDTWLHYSREDGFGKGGVSAVAKRGALIWVATAFDTLIRDAGNLPAGGGLSVSTDRGQTWRWMPQPRDSRDETRYKPTTTHVQNLTYDIAISRDHVWIASFGGGLRRSAVEDPDAAWEVVTVDGLPFAALDHLSHRAFSVHYDGQTVWVGTAGGIHKSTDEGENWTTFTHQNQPHGISGNFVVALKSQKTASRDLLWAATVNALGESEYRAVSVTEDGGLTWRVVLPGVFAHNFAVDDSIVYAATDEGLYKSIDAGATWAVFPEYRAAATGRRLYATGVHTAAADGESGLWVGTSDGLAYSPDGFEWRIFQAYMSPGEDGTPATYAFPNPFSPLRHNRAGDDGHVRFQYRLVRDAAVTVRIYDFGMKRVRSLIEQAFRPPGDHAEAWNGRNDLGDMVANGVYFYRIDIPGRPPLWGKVMVVN